MGEILIVGLIIKNLKNKKISKNQNFFLFLKWNRKQYIFGFRIEYQKNVSQTIFKTLLIWFKESKLNFCNLLRNRLNGFQNWLHKSRYGSKMSINKRYNKVIWSWNKLILTLFYEFSTYFWIFKLKLGLMLPNQW